MGSRKKLANLPRKLAAYSALYVEGLGLTGDRPVRGPMYAQVSISDLCNHQCAMCPYHPPGEDSNRSGGAFAGTRPGLMSLDTFRSLASDLHRLGTLQIDLVGRGEPLLNKACADMVAYASGLGLDVSLTSNGSRLTAAAAERLVDAGLARLKISLNAGRAGTYPLIHVTETPSGHRAVLDNVRMLRKTRDEKKSRAPHITLSFTIVQANRAELLDMLQCVDEAGADAAWFQHVIDDEGLTGLALTQKQLRELREVEIPRALQEARRRGIEHNLDSFSTSLPPGADGTAGVVPCYIGSYFTSVLGNGEVAPCCQINHSVGSLANSDFASIWASEEYREFRRAARNLPAQAPILKTAECDKCYFRSHNETIDSVLHPLGKRSLGRKSPRIPLRHLVRMKRTDKP